MTMFKNELPSMRGSVALYACKCQQLYNKNVRALLAPTIAGLFDATIR